MKTFQTTITRKGQITLPKALLSYLGLQAMKRVKIQVKPKKTIKITPLPDILDLAGKYQPKKKFNAVELREKLEKTYERR